MTTERAPRVLGRGEGELDVHVDAGRAGFHVPDQLLGERGIAALGLPSFPTPCQAPWRDLGDAAVDLAVELLESVGAGAGSTAGRFVTLVPSLKVSGSGRV
jgi:hypothetical protein